MKNLSIQYLRVLSMFMIVICHLVQESSNAYIRMTAQFFNVGVFIFFVISGFLYGSKFLDESGKNYKSWYVNRWKKVLCPFYIFLILLLLIYVILQKNIEFKNWIFQFLNLQGLEIYVNGAEHLWFLTVMAICYLITPLLNEWKKREMKFFPLIFCLLWITGMLSTFFISSQMGLYTIYIITYVFGYMLGHKKIQIKGNLKRLLLCLMLLVAAFIRLITKSLWDGTSFYTVLCVGITQSIIAVSLLLIFLSLKFRENKIIIFLDGISYEIYLVHYMFIVGPICLIGITGNLFMDSIIVILFTLVGAFLLAKASAFVTDKGSLKKRI